MRSIYMDERWGKLQQSKEKGEAVTYEFEYNGKQIRYPFIKRTAGIVDDTQYYDIATPRGFCGLYMINVDADEMIKIAALFDNAFNEYCDDEKIVAEYIRFSPWRSDVDAFKDLYDIQYYGELYCNNLTVDFFCNEYKKSVKSSIEKAVSKGVEVRFSTDPESIDCFLCLYEATAQKYGVNEYYQLDKQFIGEYFKHFPDETIIAEAIYDKKVICSGILLLGEDVAHDHFAGTHPEYTFLQANSLRLYEMSKYAAKKGKKLIDLGGAKAGSTLEQFKKRFTYNAPRYPCYTGKRIRNEDVYKQLVIDAGGSREGFFPAYRR